MAQNWPWAVCAEYGDKDNADLAARFNVKTADFPHYRLFKKGAAESPIEYKGEKTAAGFLKFVQEMAGAWVGLPGQVQELDALAKELIGCAPSLFDGAAQTLGPPEAAARDSCACVAGRRTSRRWW